MASKKFILPGVQTLTDVVQGCIDVIDELYSHGEEPADNWTHKTGLSTSMTFIVNGNPYQITVTDLVCKCNRCKEHQ